MQCFQKDPNLRVSARKLLKHPWIVNARRSDSVVPTHPPKYDEAVKSVQQWNEALRSPDANSLRKASRPGSSSPVPARRDATPTQLLPATANRATSIARLRKPAEMFRSPIADGNGSSDPCTVLLKLIPLEQMITGMTILTRSSLRAPFISRI